MKYIAHPLAVGFLTYLCIIFVIILLQQSLPVLQKTNCIYLLITITLWVYLYIYIERESFDVEILIRKAGPKVNSRCWI